MMQAMHDHGVHRLVCVSSSVTDPETKSHDTGGGFVFEKVLKPFITNVIGKTLYADLLRMEQLMMASDLDWTIVRPSGLFETPGVTAYRVGEGFLRERFTSRADLAACMLEQAGSDQYLRKTLAVATVAVEAADGQAAAEGSLRHLHRRFQGPAGSVALRPNRAGAVPATPRCCRPGR